MKTATKMVMRRTPYVFNKQDAYRFANFVHARVREKRGELYFWECPFCHSKTDHESFSICLEGEKAGTYSCFRDSCKASGYILSLTKLFNGFQVNSKFKEYWEPEPEKYRRYATPKKPIVPTDPAVAYLKSRGISEDVTKKYELATFPGKNNILVFNFYDDKGVLRFIKYRKTDFVKGVDKCKEWIDREDGKDGKSGMPILFGMKQCDPSTHTLIITEGQMDSLSCAEAGFNNAVSVPTGVNGFTWIPHCWDWIINNFKTIIVFGDHEKGHITLVEDIRKYFSQLDVKNVRPEDYKDCKDANDILRKYGKDQIKTCIENADSAPIPNVISLADVRATDNNNCPKVITGFKPLDKILHGGLPTGGLTIVTAKRGEGKSTLTSQLLLRGASQGYRCFAYSGELGAPQFKYWMDRQAAGRQFIYSSMNPMGYIDYSIPNNVESAVTEWYRDRIDFYDINSKFDGANTETILDVCEKEIIRNKAEIILIDNLMTAMSLQRTAGADKYERQANFVNELATLASAFECCVILVAHKRKNSMGEDENDEISGAAEISNLASVTISYDRSKDIDPNDRLLKVSKNRLFGDINPEGWVVHYEPASKRLYCDGDDLDFEVGWNVGNTTKTDEESVEDLFV